MLVFGSSVAAGQGAINPTTFGWTYQVAKSCNLKMLKNYAIGGTNCEHWKELLGGKGPMNFSLVEQITKDMSLSHTNALASNS